MKLINLHTVVGVQWFVIYACECFYLWFVVNSLTSSLNVRPSTTFTYNKVLHKASDDGLNY